MICDNIPKMNNQATLFYVRMNEGYDRESFGQLINDMMIFCVSSAKKPKNTELVKSFNLLCERLPSKLGKFYSDKTYKPRTFESCELYNKFYHLSGIPLRDISQAFLKEKFEIDVYGGSLFIFV